MSRIGTLIRDLQRAGVSFDWQESGLVVQGSVESLETNLRERLRQSRQALKTWLEWKFVQDRTEERFGHPGARLYPFVRLRGWQVSPTVGTPYGPGRVLQVIDDRRCWIVLEADVQHYIRLTTSRDKTAPPTPHLVPVTRIEPPETPPEPDLFPELRGSSVARRPETPLPPAKPSELEELKPRPSVPAPRKRTVNPEQTRLLARLKQLNAIIPFNAAMGKDVSKLKTDRAAILARVNLTKGAV